MKVYCSKCKYFKKEVSFCNSRHLRDVYCEHPSNLLDTWYSAKEDHSSWPFEINHDNKCKNFEEGQYESKN